MYEITQVKKMILPNTLEKKNYNIFEQKSKTITDVFVWIQNNGIWKTIFKILEHLQNG